MTNTSTSVPTTPQEASIFLDLYKRVGGMPNDDIRYIAGLIDGYRLREEQNAKEKEESV